MINEERTLKDFYYTSDTLTHGSSKRVWRICIECGKEDEVRYSHYYDGGILCASCAKSGDRSPMRNRPVSKETRLKLVIANTGSRHHTYGLKPEENSNWKGGPKLARARSKSKRRELFGFIPHNKPQVDFDGHHIDFNHVIFIPKELHRSVKHSVTKDTNMDVINDLVCDWYLDDQLNYT